GGAVLLVHLRRAHQTLRGVPAGARLVAHGRAPHERLRGDARALGRLADLTNTAGDSTRARAASPRGGAARGGSARGRTAGGASARRAPTARGTSRRGARPTRRSRDRLVRTGGARADD